MKRKETEDAKKKKKKKKKKMENLVRATIHRNFMALLTNDRGSVGQRELFSSSILRISSSVLDLL